MTNPFENPDRGYLVLVNDEGQHSLWPDDIDVPEGWQTVHRGTQAGCLEHIAQQWTDMRPRSGR